VAVSSLSVLLEDLNPAQRAAVTSEAQPLCVLAGAGSGKTRVLTRRISWRVGQGTAGAGHVMAVTFTRHAAGELRGRLRALGVRDQVAAGTFHGLAYAQLRRRWADRGERVPTLLDRKARVLGQLLSDRVGRAAAGAAGEPAGAQPADLAAEVEWAQARMFPPSAYEAAAAAHGRRPPIPAPEMATLYQDYEAWKRRQGVVDFDDLLLACATAVEEDAEFAAMLRWRYRHLFVDEFQDVNPAQFRLLRAWLGDGLDLCVVGDPNQAIYSWNGADPGLLDRLAERYPAAGVVSLEDNYRSSPQILAVANAVLAQGGRSSRGGDLRATRMDGAVPAVRRYPTDTAEAVGVARAVRDAHRPGTPWSHLAVLARTNAQLVLLGEAMRAAGVPFRVPAGAAFLDRPEVGAALAQLRRAPASVPFLSALADLEAELAESHGGVEERRLHVETVVRLGREYAGLDGSASAEGFATWLAATVRSEGADTRGDAVELTTFHRAKGLEWRAVFLAGLESGLVPIGHASTAAAEAEERRLLYVAVTRAREELHCSWAERRKFGSRTLSRRPSPYLQAVELACSAMAEGKRPDRAELQRLLSLERARLARGDEAQRAHRRDRRGEGWGNPARELARRADPQVLDALRAWRATAARASGVPAQVIFHDATLAAVAEARPSTAAELLALPGLGPVKAARYGDTLLALLAQVRRPA